MKKKFDITHYIACYNEEKYIINTLKKLILASKICKIKNQIIIIDDASTDQSYPLIKKFIKKKGLNNIYIIKRKKNLGISKNYKYALLKANGYYFRMVCGDDVENINTHKIIFKALYFYDLIIPSYNKVFGKGFFRSLISKTFTILINLITNNNIGYYNGSIAVRTSLIKYIEIPDGFGFQSFIITKILKIIKKNNFKYLDFKTIAIHRVKKNKVILKNFIRVIKIISLILLEKFK